MARYILTHKRAGLHSLEQLGDSRKLLEEALKKIPNKMIHEHFVPEDPHGRHTVVLEAEPREIAALKKVMDKSLILEREVRHKPHAQTSTQVDVKGGGAPLDAARITIYYAEDGALSTLPFAFTGRTGRAVVTYDSSIEPVFVIAEPAGDFWSIFTETPTSHVRFRCPTLPRATPLEWWHRVVGVKKYDERRGKGIRVGVVGTGVGPHPRLRHVVLIDGKPDVERHETHVCGIIAARPSGKGEFAGIAPGASVFSARIFSAGPSGEPVPDHQGVIADAIERLARPLGQNGFAADLINLSFGSPEPSAVLRDAIQWAFEQGTLCICSTGNTSGGAIEYPAAFRETVAVTALGKVGWGPLHSTGKHWVPTEADRFGQHKLFLAGMSAIGAKVDCTAPGNGIISTIPKSRGNPAPYGAMDGTSMASPMACGVLAAVLSDLPAYRALPRTAARARMARKILRDHCTTIGLKPEYEGKGLPII
jgi:subtilisin